jgi:hypothetical protein
LRRCLVALPLAAFLLLALSAPGLASWMLPGSPIWPKDFTLVKHEGLYHIFYIRADHSLPPDSTARDFGHAVSPDLWYWTQYPPVLPARDTSWDRSQVWAPSIVERDGVFYMFYTGVSTIPGVVNGWQSLGLATSTDLFTWNRMDAPVYECADAPWTVCDSSGANHDFRDPFVMEDPAHPGQWLLYYVTRPTADSAGMVVGVASSTGDLTQWSDLGPLWITNRQYSYNAVDESPHLFSHAGLWYLFWTTDAGQPISFATGPDPVGPPESWNYRGRLSWMLGVDTKAWYASEHLGDGLVDYFAYVMGDRISIMKMTWGADWTFSLTQPDWMHVIHMSWDSTQVASRDTATLSIVAANWSGASAQLEGVRIRPDGSELPLALDSLGLPTSVMLTGDTTRVPWPAHWIADPVDTTDALRLVVRLTDQTAIAPMLEIPAPPPLVVSAMIWDSASVQRGDTTRLSIVAENWQERSVGLEAVRVWGDGSRVPVPLDSLGLPAIVPLAGDTTSLVWAARWLRDAADTVRVMRLVVRHAGGTIETPPLDVIGPAPLAVRSMAWDSASVLRGDTTRLSIVAENWQERSVGLEAVRVRSDGLRLPLSLDTLGLPPVVPLAGDTTSVAWAARWLRDTPDTARVMRLVVRDAGGSIETPPLDVIGPPPLMVQSMAWDSASVQDGHGTRLAIVAENWESRCAALAPFRVRRDSVLVPLVPDSLGLPTVLPLDGDTTFFAWTAKWLPDEPDTGRALRLLVRLTDSTAAAPVLAVIRPPSIQRPAPAPMPPSPIDDPVVLWHGPARFRALPRQVAGQMALLVDLDAPAPARLDIFDAQGRRVRRLADRELPKGASVILWDGRGADGIAARAGIYFARLVLPEGSRTVRLVRLR